LTEDGRRKTVASRWRSWYDEVRGEAHGSKERIPVVTDDIKRIKVVPERRPSCKLRYKEGQARRRASRTSSCSLHYEDVTTRSPNFSEAGRPRRSSNLRDKQHVTVRFIGYTDDAPLTDRDERIYGNHLSLSKARAHRVALAMQERWDCRRRRSRATVAGRARWLQRTAQGRTLNRRVEVEFWYDDPLRSCRTSRSSARRRGEEMVTKVYDPPWGTIATLELVERPADRSAGYAAICSARCRTSRIAPTRALRFIGYTKNERSTAAPRRSTATTSACPPRGAPRHGHRHAGSAVAAPGRARGTRLRPVRRRRQRRLHQGDKSFVRVQVVYDEPLPIDDYEGVDITRITRELTPKSPYELNVMRITVDGKPIDDPVAARPTSSAAPTSRSTRPRSSSTSTISTLAATLRRRASARHCGEHAGDRWVPGRAFPHVRQLRSFIERAEIRIFDTSNRCRPCRSSHPGRRGRLVEWQPSAKTLAVPSRELKYVLRAYDAKGKFDETDARPLWLYREASPGDSATADASATAATADPDLLAAYGEADLARHEIPLGGGKVTVRGSDIPAGHTVWVAGRQVPVDPQGRFASEELLPPGAHTVEVAVLDDAGNGSLYLRDLEFKRTDLFYMGIADITVSESRANGPVDQLQGANTLQPYDSSVDGRLAFYLNGKVNEKWHLTASADTREGPIEDLFSNFLDKSPESLFRRIDPDYHYPTFGDDSVVEEMAPTLGKFFFKATHGENYGLWGNFKVGYMGNELAQVDRGLYGANGHYGSQATTSFGERKVVVDAFAAQPGTMPSYEEFRGTGGSLYYLRHQDMLTGSERVRIELRDKDSGIVTGVVNLRPGMDYDIDYLQGRILLSEPLSSTAEDNLLVRTSGLSGDEAYLVARYEFTPGLDELDALAVGGQGQFWFGDYVRLGVTANTNDENNTDSSLGAADLTLRMSTDSWIKLQAGTERRPRVQLAAVHRRRVRVPGPERCRVPRCGGGSVPRRRELRTLGLHEPRRPHHPLRAEHRCRLLGSGPGDDQGHDVLRRHVQDADHEPCEPGAQGRSEDRRAGTRDPGDRAQRRRQGDRQVDDQRRRAQRRARGQLAGRRPDPGNRRSHGCRRAGGVRHRRYLAHVRLPPGHGRLERQSRRQQPRRRGRLLQPDEEVPDRRGGFRRRPRAGRSDRHQLPGVRANEPVPELFIGERADRQRPESSPGQPGLGRQETFLRQLQRLNSTNHPSLI
jgi:hypothetical protein